MSHRLGSRSASAPTGWRARAWAWVLFLALFKGLIPHAALASVAMSGSPALIWCAPGKAASAADEKADAARAAEAHGCVCASAADGGLPAGSGHAGFAVAAHDRAALPVLIAAARSSPLPPPARGPPVL